MIPPHHIGLFRYVNPSPSNPCLASASIKPWNRSQYPLQLYPDSHAALITQYWRFQALRRTFFVITKLVPIINNRVSHWIPWKERMLKLTDSHSRCDGQCQANVPITQSPPVNWSSFSMLDAKSAILLESWRRTCLPSCFPTSWDCICQANERIVIWHNQAGLLGIPKDNSIKPATLVYQKFS